MYKELCKRNKPKFLDISIIFFICFGLLYGFNWILYKTLKGSSYADFFTIIFMAYLIYFIIRRYIMAYKYMIIEDELIIRRIIGAKEKVLVDININQIEQIKEEKTSRIKKSSIKRSTFWNNCKNKSVLIITYIEDGNKNEFEFQPSDKMMTIISKRMTKKILVLNKNSQIV